jgi:hypothetical protein
MRSLLTPWLVIPAALAAMAALMLVAVEADCVRIADERDAEVRVVDDAMRKLEDRWVAAVLKSEYWKEKPHGLDTAADAEERHERFRRYVEIERTYPHEGAWRPEWNAVRDEAQGIANRWEIMERDYLRRAAERDAFRNSWRGKIAAERASTSDAAQ